MHGCMVDAGHTAIFMLQWDCVVTGAVQSCSHPAIILICVAMLHESCVVAEWQMLSLAWSTYCHLSMGTVCGVLK